MLSMNELIKLSEKLRDAYSKLSNEDLSRNERWDGLSSLSYVMGYIDQTIRLQVKLDDEKEAEYLESIKEGECYNEML